MKEHNYNQRVKRPVIYRPREAKETYGAVEALKSNDEEALTFIAQGLVFNHQREEHLYTPLG